MDQANIVEKLNIEEKMMIELYGVSHQEKEWLDQLYDFDTYDDVQTWLGVQTESDRSRIIRLIDRLVDVMNTEMDIAEIKETADFLFKIHH